MKLIKNLIDRYQNNIKYYVGYPQNLHFDYSELYDTLKYPINNYGDPFLLQNPVSNHEFEQEVIRWFLKLYGLSDKNGWGYVTSGGTEGILFGVWQAKEHLNNPVLYFSDYAHYAVMKTARITGLDYKVIKTDEKGEMNYDDFEGQLDKSRDAIVLATFGNTITSAIDRTDIIKRITEKANIKTYIHADAAFDGMILPFTKTPYNFKLTDGIDSVSISGHKVIGSPIPCGVVLINKNYIKNTNRTIDYINNLDCTVSGSRSGFAALVLWHAIFKNKQIGFKNFIKSCQANAKSYTDILISEGINAWRFDHALTIVLNKLPSEITVKWRAPSNHKYTTLTALPKLTKEMLLNLIKDIKHFEANGYLLESKGIVFPKVTHDITLND